MEAVLLEANGDVEEVYERATIAYALTGNADELRNRIIQGIDAAGSDFDRSVMAALLLVRALGECDFTFRRRLRAGEGVQIGEQALELLGEPRSAWEERMAELLRLHLDRDIPAVQQAMQRMRIEGGTAIPDLVDIISYFACIATLVGIAPYSEGTQ